VKNALLLSRWVPEGMSSAHTSMATSIEELNERVTWAFRVTTLPSLMGFLKDTLSTDAVTTILLVCFCAEIAEAISIQCINRPPIKLFSVLVSLGSTNSVMVTRDSLGDFFLLGISVIIFSSPVHP
jgi:hypothetical protein